jgi:SNF2 family DNA or RNA helicase
MITFEPHQLEAFKLTEGKNRVAYYLDMGLGKTFVGAEKLNILSAPCNLLICQCSKVDDWIEHFLKYYAAGFIIYNLTEKSQFEMFMRGIKETHGFKLIGIINYELAFRRKELLDLKRFTLMLDESSMIQNETVKRSKFVLKLTPENVILLSGTPTSGKYEKLWSQVQLLGWKISKKLFWSQYVDVEYLNVNGFPVKTIKGYKNVDRLKRKLAQHGAVFMKDDILKIQQNDIPITISTTKEYRKFMRTSIVTVEGKDLVGDTTLTKRLYARQLCGQYNQAKLEAFRDLIESTEDRLIVFYNFNEELQRMLQLVGDRPVSIVNGEIKDQTAYRDHDNSITFVQYQAGAKGLNLQKANKIVYFTLTQSCEDWMQSKKRIHRMGQERSCFYYYLMCKNSVEEDILKALKSGRDYTDNLFGKCEGE